MFYIAWFTFAWALWLRYADKKRWREMLPVCIFACFLAVATDELMHHYPLWEYGGSPLLYNLADNLAIYPVVVYLFIQFLPAQPTARNMVGYWLAWTTLAISIELIYVYSGHLYYHQWWSIWHSYVSDWFLYWLFYKFHQSLRLDRLSML